jgi:hypothetical protein
MKEIFAPMLGLGGNLPFADNLAAINNGSCDVFIGNRLPLLAARPGRRSIDVCLAAFGCGRYF